MEHRQLGEGGRGVLGGLLSFREFYEAGYIQADAAEAERLVDEAFARFAEHEGQTKTQGEGVAPNTL